MIQGGGMDENMNEKETRDPIQNEASNGLPNDKYTIAMARTSDPIPPARNSSSTLPTTLS